MPQNMPLLRFYQVVTNVKRVLSATYSLQRESESWLEMS